MYFFFHFRDIISTFDRLVKDLEIVRVILAYERQQTNIKTSRNGKTLFPSGVGTYLKTSKQRILFNLFITEGIFVCACASRNKRVVHESRDCRGNPDIGGNFKVQFVNKLFQTYDICHLPNF